MDAERAIRFAKVGWHVFPIRKDRLHPAGHMHWPNTGDPAHPRHKCTTSPKALRSMDWDGDCWLGLRPEPSGILCLDLDDHDNGNGMETWARWVNGRKVPDGPSQTSPRGRHLFFKARRARLLTLIEGVDLIGKAGVTIDGEGYEWDEGRAPWEIAAPTAPAWLQHLLDPALTKERILAWSRRQR